MKRRVTMLVLLLVLGAIVNVLVSWSLAIRPWPETTLLEHIPDHPDTILSVTYAEVAFGERTISQERIGLFVTPADSIEISEDEFTALLPPGSVFHNQNPALRGSENTGPNEVDSYVENAFGLPMLSFRHTRIGRSEVDDEETDAIALPIGIGIAERLERWDFRSELPCRPIWPGFAINTFFYATVIWLLFFAPFALRRRLRIRRGLCPACAYPRSQSQVCTECGKTFV